MSGRFFGLLTVLAVVGGCTAAPKPEPVPLPVQVEMEPRIVPLTLEQDRQISNVRPGS